MTKKQSKPSKNQCLELMHSEICSSKPKNSKLHQQGKAHSSSLL